MGEWIGAELEVHDQRAGQSFGSSTRPSTPLAKKPIGYGTRSWTTFPYVNAYSESEKLPVPMGVSGPKPRMSCWSTQV